MSAKFPRGGGGGANPFSAIRLLMIKARIRLIFSRYTTTELSILLTSCLTAIKTMSLNIAQQFMKEMVKNYFGLLKIQMKFLINRSLEVFKHLVCLHMISLLSILHCLII